MLLEAEEVLLLLIHNNNKTSDIGQTLLCVPGTCDILYTYTYVGCLKI